MRRAFNLNIAPGAKQHHPLRDPQLELFNESGFVIVRDNFTLPFLTPKISSGSSIFMFCFTAT